MWVEQHRKLIAAHAECLRTGWDCPPQHIGDQLQQAVAAFMAKQIVDRAEILDVDQQQRGQFVALLVAVGQHFLQILAVAQLGQAVVLGGKLPARVGAAQLNVQRIDAERELVDFIALGVTAE